VKLGIPAAIVACLAVIALVRVGAPPPKAGAVGTAGRAPGAVADRLTQAAELLTNNAVGREARLEHVPIRQRVGDRYLWIGSGDERPVFVVLDADVKRTRLIELSPGERVTFTGIVRPAPKAAEAVQQWNVSPATATLIEESGTYLHATEVER
jgi:hypothetical protein